MNQPNTRPDQQDAAHPVPDGPAHHVDDRLLALMALMREIDAPLASYRHALSATSRTETDSPANQAAKAVGNRALLDIEEAVRRWVAEHPEQHAGDGRPPFTAAWRVQCSGPCRRWLSIPDGYEPGTDMPLGALVGKPTAEHAGLWPSENAARRAAFAAGWSGGTCPDCGRLAELEALGCRIWQVTERSLPRVADEIDRLHPWVFTKDYSQEVDGKLQIVGLRVGIGDKRVVARFGDWLVYRPSDGTWSVHAAPQGADQ